MANHKSAAKRARQTPKKTTRNTSAKGAVRSFEKKLRAAISSNDVTEAQTLLRTYSSKVAKAAQKGIIKVQTMSRKISRLSQQVTNLSKS